MQDDCLRRRKCCTTYDRTTSKCQLGYNILRDAESLTFDVKIAFTTGRNRIKTSSDKFRRLVGHGLGETSLDVSDRRAGRDVFEEGDPSQQDSKQSVHPDGSEHLSRKCEGV